MRKETNFSFDRLYDEIPLDGVLTDGENCIAVLTVSSKKAPFMLEIEQGGETVSASDGTWRVYAEKAYRRTIGCRGRFVPFASEERFDARLALEGWQEAAFDDGAWTEASVLDTTWDEMRRYEPMLMEERTVYPDRLCSLEGGLPAKGSRLVVEPLPGEGLSLYATCLYVKEDADCIVRSQHERYGKPELSIDGRKITLDETIRLSKGSIFFS